MSSSLSLETVKRLKKEVEHVEGFSSDSRSVHQGCLFVALKGLNSDGHLFVEELVRSGQCPAAVVSQEFFDQASKEIQSKSIAVEDTHLAHRLLAQLFREKFEVPLVAIGGSAGKTSTKEFLKSLCEKNFNLIATRGSQNGHQGIPKTLEGLTADIELAIVEVGIDQIGDMQKHVDLLQPDYAVLTSIGEEHLENLRDLPTVFEEESQLFDGTLKRGGKCFAPSADIWMQKYKGDYVGTPSSTQDLLPPLSSSFHGVLEQNLCLAVEVAKAVGVPVEQIQAIVQGLEVPEGRGRVVESSFGERQIFILDHYNSNPSSLKAAFSEVKRRLADDPQQLHLVLGEMRELGKNSTAYHAEALKQALGLNPKNLILIGKEFQKALDPAQTNQAKVFLNVQEAASACKPLSNQPGLFLFKGSRGVQLEKLFPSFPTLPSSF